MNKALKTILGVAGVLIIAGASFYGGMLYGESQAPATAAALTLDMPEGFQPPDGADMPGAGMRPGGAGQGGAAGGFAAPAGMTFGEIESIDGATLTLATQSDGTLAVQVTDTTLIEKNASVDVTDLVVGEMVIVSGSENDDGSITARSVQVSPAGRFMGGPSAGDAPADR
jgi:hypothetical protein